MKYTILTLFPEIVDSYFKSSIMAKAIEKGIVEYECLNIRDFARDKHHSADDAPYGGGAGMLMLAEPLGFALKAAGMHFAEASEGGSFCAAPEEKNVRKVVYMSPSGRLLTQSVSAQLAQCRELVIICGRYEGIDQRIIDKYVDDELSIGDYVLSSGEVASLVLVDATYRLLPGVITAESLDEESFGDGGDMPLLEYPQYTRPEVYEGAAVPDVLLSGNHAEIRKWRTRKRVEKTLAVRPDLIKKGLAENLFSADIIRYIDEISRNV
jgi:tRNA (guanine37-N1)-methyltransferase